MKTLKILFAATLFALFLIAAAPAHAGGFGGGLGVVAARSPGNGPPVGVIVRGRRGFVVAPQQVIVAQPQVVVVQQRRRPGLLNRVRAAGAAFRNP
jgi:hypothetical protein